MGAERTAIRVAGLAKRYGSHEALRGIDFEIAAGEVFGLLGPNGAGKTTTIEILEGYRERDAGEVEVLGEDPQRADRTWRERLVLILHIGYAFVPLGFLLNAASAFGFVPAGAGIHAWMVGAAGTMTLAVMSRATLGHTGQHLTASVTTQAIYAAIIVAALSRICAVIAPVHSELLLHVAAFAWAGAFLGFAISFGPLLAGSDRRVKPKAAA